MKYSKHFSHDGIVIIFDKLEVNKEYPYAYIATRKGNVKPTVFIPKRKVKVIRKTEIAGKIKIVTFGFDE